MTRIFKVEQLVCITCNEKIRVRTPVDATESQRCPDCNTPLMALGRINLDVQLDDGWRELPHQGGWLESPDGRRWEIGPGVLRVRPLGPDDHSGCDY